MPAHIQPKEKRLPSVTIMNAKLIYRNFAGAAKTFNAKGLRNFHVVLPEDIARKMQADGWNVKFKEREDGDSFYHLKVAVSFDNIPPRIVMIAPNGNKTVLKESTVGILDNAELEMVDIELAPSRWTNAKQETGIKAWLRKAFVTLSANDLESKYLDSSVETEEDGG